MCTTSHKASQMPRRSSIVHVCTVTSSLSLCPFVNFDYCCAFLFLVVVCCLAYHFYLVCRPAQYTVCCLAYYFTPLLAPRPAHYLACLYRLANRFGHWSPAFYSLVVTRTYPATETCRSSPSLVELPTIHVFRDAPRTGTVSMELSTRRGRGQWNWGCPHMPLLAVLVLAAYFGLQLIGECWCGISYRKHGTTTCEDCAIGSTFAVRFYWEDPLTDTKMRSMACQGLIDHVGYRTRTKRSHSSVL